MIKLWIYTKDHCAWFDVDSIHEYDRFQFERRNQGVCIFYKQNKKVLKCNESCILDHTTFFLDEKQSTQCHFPIETSIQVGRSSLCNIQLFKSGVSRFHFKIEKDVLTDLDSLNGTYVNTKRVHSYKLNMQDEIVIANVRMIYFKNYLLVDMVDNPFENKDLKREEPMFYPSNLNVQLPTIQTWDIQMPQIHRVVCKQSLFSAIGPSCMIASSGFISSILIGYLQKQSVETLFMSMISSLTMAVTFMIYGLYNRNYQYKLSVKENQKSLDMYDGYLKRMYEKEGLLKHDFEKKVNLYIKKYVDTFKHETKDIVYVGCTKLKWCAISYREVSYEYALNDLIQKRERLIESLNSKILQPVFLKKGEVCWIKGNIEESLILFENYLWYSNSMRKWLWLQDFDEIKDVLLNPFCIVNEKSNSEFIVVTRDLKCQPKEYYCLIYIGKKEPSFHYDYCIQNICISNINKDQKRYLLKSQNMDFYQELIENGPIRKERYVMRVPVGMRESNQIVYMDFRKYGSHGLVAGMTGFGKSEFISFLLMMMIWHNAPSQFQYILIDFKGGAFGQPFYEFAHCAGIVTNLDAQSMERFFMSMNYELEKRQRLFLVAKVADINAYNETHTLSHLWIFVDEFAQLKTRFPQFMSQLQEIARIGRSLGIHLVLSTQKPLGIIDDQVMSNTSWKACFHVNNVQDSREILQNEKAYTLKNPGDMVLQTKNESLECKSFYLQKYVDEKSWREVNERKEVIQSKQHLSKRVIDALKEKINVLKEEKSWVLLPKKVSKEDFVILDLPFKQKQCELVFDHLQLIYTKSMDIVYSLINYFKDETIYVYGTHVLNDYVDFNFFKSRCFHQILSGVCIVFEDENLDLSLLNENVRAFIITENENTRLKWIQSKYVFDVDSLDDKRIYFDTYQLPSYLNMTCYENTYVECIYNRVSESNLKRRACKPFSYRKERNCIGFESQSDCPVFIDEKRKLYILYMHEEYKCKAYKLCENLSHLKICSDLSSNSDIYVIYVDFKQLTNEVFQKALYQAQVLWVGYGLKEYGYTLRRKLPYESFDCVFFKDQNEGIGVYE